MTASGVASLAIAMSQQRRTKADVLKAAEIKKGVDWLAKHNPEPGDDHPFYYLFVIACAGIAAEAATIGDIDWYKNGAAWLLKRQRMDGSWEWWGHPVTHTSFALIFLSAGRPPGDED